MLGYDLHILGARYNQFATRFNTDPGTLSRFKMQSATNSVPIKSRYLSLIFPSCSSSLGVLGWGRGRLQGGGSRGSGGRLGEDPGGALEKELGDPLGVASCGVGGLIHLDGSLRIHNWQLL